MIRKAWNAAQNVENTHFVKTVPVEAASVWSAGLVTVHNPCKAIGFLAYSFTPLTETKMTQEYNVELMARITLPLEADTDDPAEVERLLENNSFEASINLPDELQELAAGEAHIDNVIAQRM